MTAYTPARSRESGWALQIALILSILVHLAIVIAAMLSSDFVSRVFHVNARPIVPQNEIVTVSAPLHIERREHSVPVQLNASAARTAARRGSRAVANLSAISPPAHYHFPGIHFSAAVSSAGRGVPSALAQRAAISKILYHGSDDRDPSLVPGRYRLRMAGLRAKLRRGEGIYYPVRGWSQDRLDYYDVDYEFIYPNGSDERGSVPWPIHFEPASDPFLSADPQALANTPMPGPPAGYVPPGDLGKALRAYFPDLRFEDG